MLETQTRAPPHDPRGRFASPREAAVPVPDLPFLGRGGQRPEPRDATEAAHRLYLVGQGYSAETVRLRLANLRLFARWASEHDVSLTSASHDAVASYLAEQLGTVRQVTARSRLHALRSFFAFCQGEGWRRDDPTAGIRIKLPNQQPKRPFTADEVRALLSACCNPRDRAIVLILAATGARVSELLRMETDDIDWERGVLLIRGKGSKERWVALGGVAFEALRQQVNGQHGPIWRTAYGPAAGQPMKRILVRDMLQALSRRSGVTHVGAHRFRITFANSFLSEGGDLGALQVLMGHSTITMTAHYAGFTAAARALEQQRRCQFVDRLAGDLDVPESGPWRCSICGGTERHGPTSCPAVPEEVRRLWCSMGGVAKAEKEARDGIP